MEKLELHMLELKTDLHGAEGGFEDLQLSTVTAAQAVALLEKRLLVLRLSFGKVKAALERLIAPFANLLLPVLSRTMVSLAAFLNRMARVAAALLGGSEAGKAMTENQQKLQKSLKSTARELARFDTLNRIGSLSGDGEDAITLPPVEDGLSPSLQALAQRIQALLLPLKNIDLSHITQAFRELSAAVEPISRSLFSGLEWAWFNLIIPMAQWVAEDALPAFLRVLAAALDTLNAACKPLQENVAPAFFQLLASSMNLFSAACQMLQPLGQWLITGFLQAMQEKVAPAFFQTLASAMDLFTAACQALQPVGQWLLTNFLQPLMDKGLPAFMNLLSAAMDVLAATCRTLQPLIQWLFENFLQPLAAWTGQLVIAGLEAITQKLRDFAGWVDSNRGKVQGFTQILDGMAAAWNTVSTAVKKAWQQLHPEEDFFSRLGKTALNGLISLVNGVLSAVSSAVNGLVGSLNKLSFTVPDWVPVVGGKHFGFSLKTVSFPKIPYLAQGAVLPANKPFLAVVGDQKNGTNVEAPLATIQQALSEVLARQGMQPVTVEFTGDLAQLGRVLRPVLLQEDRRTGQSLAKGVAV